MRARRNRQQESLGLLAVGELVRDAREEAGLTQAALAEAITTKQSVVSRWEHGDDTPRLDTLVRILRACGFEADLTLRRHDDVDRAQIREQLAMSPRDRLRSVENVSRMKTLARRA
jgi:transcriptional regulator with XRE-family HTH domain